MSRLFLIFTLCCAVLNAEMPLMNMGAENQKIGVQNSILAKVNGTTISMMDVKKKMDLLFHQSYPHLIQSNQARFQFYQASWRNVLMEMIDNELILADAADKEIKLTDAEVREEVENRFGPNVMDTLDKIGVTYDEAWKMVRNEMIVRRMSWWFIQSKAFSQITPQEIRQAYRQHLQKNPSYTELTYRVLTIKGEALQDRAEELYQMLSSSLLPPEKLEETLKQFEAAHPGVSLSFSNEYTAKDLELSDSHRNAMVSVEPLHYSKPMAQSTRDKKELARIFYVAARVEHPSQSFDELAPLLKNDLLQKSSSEISQTYIEKLRKHYRFDAKHMNESLPEDFQPFALQ